MSDPRNSGQNVFSRFGLVVLGLAAGIAASAAAWYLMAAPELPPILPVPIAAAAPRRIPEKIVEQARAPQMVPVKFDPPAPAEATPRAAGTNESGPSLPLLEQRFLASRGKEDRMALAREIAGPNDAAAVATLARIFPFERHPEIKVALLSSLNDINHAEALDTRIALLASALRGQPRDVRTTALDCLAQLDDSRVAPLLKKAMKDDPDKEVRDIAAALYKNLPAAR